MRHDKRCTVVTYKVGCIHDAILDRMGAVQGELQDLLLLLSTLLLHHLLLLTEKCKSLIKPSAPSHQLNASLDDKTHRRIYFPSS